MEDPAEGGPDRAAGAAPPPGPCHARGRTAGSGPRSRWPGARRRSRRRASRPRRSAARRSSATTTVPTLPPAMWALMANPRRSAGNCSARRPLPTGCWGEPPIRDAMFGMANVAKLVAKRLEREAATEQDPAVAEQPPPRDDPGQPGIAELDHARGERPDGGEEGDRLHSDAVLVDDLEEDERQDDRLGVVDRVRHGQQAERAHRVDLDRRHAGMVTHVGLRGWANQQGVSGSDRPLRRGRRRRRRAGPRAGRRRGWR